ncbi:MAG: molybdenum cofactor biosynthesis protein MoeB [Alphaproteobacteria bacterium]|nr:MAG: molybdenum cofactor biosynthesis protein MoeB [Alphaproteobacteria bacterium]
MSRNQRYDRQTIMPEIGTAGQEKLAAARVLVVGAGGLGCPVLLYLAGAGVGTIGIIDYDQVDESNLQRQVLFTSGDAGEMKATVARDRLLHLNPGIAVNSYTEELTDKNVIGLFSDYDIIVDGTDNFPAKFLINDAAVKMGKPVIYGAIQGFDGQVSVFDAGSGPCYRCLHPKIPEGVVLNCAEAGVIGALAGIIGSMQAAEAIKYIVKDASFAPLTGKLWMIDARTMETRIIKVPKRPDCPVCSRPPEEIPLESSSPVCFIATAGEIACDDLVLQDAVLVDVRELPEWSAGHIEGAVHLPLSALQKNLNVFSPPGNGKSCIFYCQRGARSRKAADMLLNAGFSNLYSLKGGFEAWRALNKDTPSR